MEMARTDLVLVSVVEWRVLGGVHGGVECLGGDLCFGLDVCGGGRIRWWKYDRVAKNDKRSHICSMLSFNIVLLKV